MKSRSKGSPSGNGLSLSQFIRRNQKMKNWLKQQFTEMTFWGGFVICASVFFTPDWMTFAIGAVLIAIDDDIAKRFVAWLAPTMSKKLDEWDDVV